MGQQTETAPLIPFGGIILWGFDAGSDKFDSTGKGVGTMIGWALCNGNNNTPNLTDRFIVYPGPQYGHEGIAEGQRTVTLTVDNMPSHTHQVNDPGHSHNLFHGSIETGEPQGNWQVGNPPTPDSYSYTGITLGNTGGGVAFDATPLYYSMYYIMRIAAYPPPQ